MSVTPPVSIVIPTYNRAQIVTQAIDSCLNQTYPNIEIIVVDDGSTDDTQDLLKRRYGGSIHYVYQDNRGPGPARNHGVEVSKGEFIHFCDADDQLLPVKVERCIRRFQQKPELGLVYTRFQPVAVDGKTPLPIQSPPILTGEDVFCQMFKSNGSPFQTSTVMIRKSVFLATGGFRENPEELCVDDWDLFLRIASEYPISGVDESLSLYRYSPDGLATNPLNIALARLRTIQYARNLKGRIACFNDREYDLLEAERHHMLALAQWRHGMRKQARQSFLSAIQLDPEHKKLRSFYRLLTYGLPADSAILINKLLRQMRNRKTIDIHT